MPSDLLLALCINLLTNFTYLLTYLAVMLIQCITWHHVVCIYYIP